MIEGIICLIMAVIFFIYSLFAFKQKGPLLTSMYYISNTMDFYSCNYSDNFYCYLYVCCFSKKYD
ncbi:hypothetical protein AVM15_01375 [Paraclostridium benzoelyticum]|nr:hypothetical protein AVM15_01375 [Paraclostridium benzoelyticum]